MLDLAQPHLLASEAPPPAPTQGITPRPYQVEGIAAARAILAEGVRRVLLVLATGGGKTIIAALVALGAVAKGKRVLFVGPRREIIAQAFWKLVEAGIAERDCGVVMADGVIPHVHTREPYRARRPNAQVQVASIQTLANRRMPPADVVFVDEAHHATSSTWSKVLAHYAESGAVVVGLTATPCRADGAGLGKWFDRLHVIAGFADLSAQGFLVTPRVFTTPAAPDLSRVKLNRAGEYDATQVAAVMRDRALVGDVVAHWQRHAEGRTTAVFAASVEHSRELCEAFRAAGVTAGHIDGAMDTDARDAVLSDLRAGSITVVCNFGVLTEGWDEPRVKCVVLARPTKSLSLFLQMCGRGLRPWEGLSAILLDHAGAVHEHGFPSDAREWSLDGKVRRKGAVAVRTCPQCYAALPAGTAVCTECGHVFEVEERKGPATVDGELVEADAAAARAPKVSMDERVAAYAAILTEGVARGRKVGWCRHRYQERFGLWPAGPRLVALERTHYPRPTVTELAAQAPTLDSDPFAGDLLAEAPIAAAAALDVPLAPPPAPAPVRARRLSFEALFAPPVVAAAPLEVESWAL
jgi:superfamily II DNA or RNA helicase